MIARMIEHDITVAAPPGQVWALVTRPEHIAAWFGDGRPGSVDLRPGGRITFQHGPHGAIPGRIEVVDPPRHVAFRWVVTDPYDEEPTPANSTRVDLRLAPDAGATLVRVTEQGDDQLTLPEADRAARYQANDQGWPGILERLRDYSAGLASPPAAAAAVLGAAPRPTPAT
jgi:uncharacterized protein YndB with AHSA1/START domain